jgi:HK97 family phage portal protein
LAEKRGLFQNVFGKKPPTPTRDYGEFRLLSSWQSHFIPFSGNAWDINAVRASVDAFARNAAKVSPRHIRKAGGTVTDVENSNLNHLLQYQPNQYMTAYAFYYRVAAQYKLNNNAFIFPVVENGVITAFYPINAIEVDLLEANGELYYSFKFVRERKHIVHHSEIIHIRRHYNDNDIFGSDNEPILPVLKTANTFNQSMNKFAELVALVRGILKLNGSPKEKDRIDRRNEFIRDNLEMERNGAGVVVTDSQLDYTELQSKQSPIPTGQLQYINEEIYNYFGTNEKIVQNKATPEEWNSYYEGEIEPFFIQLSQGFTNCCFTSKQRGFGNEIIHESNRLQYASLSDKVNAAKFLSDKGAITLDQILEIFNIAPIGGEEGKRRTQTLNDANVAIVDEYQMGKNQTNKSAADAPPKDEEEKNKDSEGDKNVTKS